MAFVFIDENPASTFNDGYWASTLSRPDWWIDSPAHYHNNGGNLSFVDGHAENHKWTDSGVLAGQFAGATGFTASPIPSRDLDWLLPRCTVSPGAGGAGGGR